MRRPALLGFLLSFLLGFLPIAARAQTQTAVSATITDPNGIPYANGTYSIQLIPTGNNPSVGGAAIQGAFNGSLSATGSFSASLWPNASITPASTQWQFTICSNSGGIQPPLGTGTQCTPPTAISISGTAQVLSTTLSNVAPKLTNFITGGTGSVTSVAATSPIVATPSPITGAGTISCPTCNTSSATIAGSIANTQVAFGTAANTIGGNAGFLFVTPNLTIPTNGIYQINGVNFVNPGPVATNNDLGIGPSSIPNISTGVNNIGIGTNTLTGVTTGSANTAVGEGAIAAASAATSNNTAVGTGALAAATGNSNTAVGQGSLTTQTSATQNTAIGTGTGGITTGGSNTFVGYLAGGNTTSGASNIVIGANSNNVVTTGSGNLAIGNNPSGITNTSSNQMTIMDVIIGTGMNVPATSTVEYKGNLKVDGTCTGCGSGVTSFSGDGTVITNSASTGAVTATIAGTSGGQPYFNSASSWASTGVLANHAIQTGGGAGGAPTTGNGDFTIDSTAHTLKAGAAGLVDLSAAAAGGLRTPNVAFGSIGTPAAGSLVWNTSNGNPIFSNGAALIWLAWAGAAGSGSTTCNSSLQYLVNISATGGPTCQSLAAATALTSQKAESAADANVLTLTPTAAAGSYRLRFVMSVSAATAAVLGWTATWKDSNGNAQAPTNLTLIQSGTAVPALTFTAAGAGNYYSDAQIDIDNSATNIVIKLTFSGTSFAAKVTATIERVI